MSIKVCIIGAAGRMGHNIAACVHENKDMEVSGAVDRKGSESIGTPIFESASCGKGGVAITDNIDEALKGADVIIDFTAASSTLENMPAYERTGVPIVIGSTGFSAEGKEKIKTLSKKTAVLMSPNMSLGVNVAFKLIELAAKSLQGYDIEIVETHHNKKKDAPSGTAIGMAEYAAKGACLDLDENAVYSRHGIIGERKANEIGIQSLRGGDVVGDHTVYFFGNGERIEITHRAHTRATFASGAVRAAKWLKGKPAGLYSMQDVLM